MADSSIKNGTEARLASPDASHGGLQKDTTTRLVRPMAYLGTVLGVVGGFFADPENWLQGMLLYGFLGFTIGIVIGSLAARLKD